MLILTLSLSKGWLPQLLHLVLRQAQDEGARYWRKSLFTRPNFERWYMATHPFVAAESLATSQTATA